MLKGDFPVDRFRGLRTPFYYYDLPLLRRTLDAVQAQLDRNPAFRMHYAVKATAIRAFSRRSLPAGSGPTA